MTSGHPSTDGWLAVQTRAGGRIGGPGVCPADGGALSLNRATNADRTVYGLISVYTTRLPLSRRLAGLELCMLHSPLDRLKRRMVFPKASCSAPPACCRQGAYSLNICRLYITAAVAAPVATSEGRRRRLSVMPVLGANACNPTTTSRQALVLSPPAK